MCKSLRYNKHGRSLSESVFTAELLYNLFLGGIAKPDARETKKACHSPGREHFSCLNDSKWFFPFPRSLSPKCLVYGCAPSQALPADTSAARTLRTNYGLTAVYVSSRVRGLYTGRWRPPASASPPDQRGSSIRTHYATRCVDPSCRSVCRFRLPSPKARCSSAQRSNFGNIGCCSQEGNRAPLHLGKTL